MSTLLTVVLIWAIGFCITLLYFLYTNGSDVSLSEDEKVGWGSSVFFAALWPFLGSLWILTTVLSGIRRIHSWLTAS